MRFLRACVIRSLFHLYEPFTLRVSKIPPLPESTPTTLLNSKVKLLKDLFIIVKVELFDLPADICKQMDLFAYGWYLCVTSAL